MDLEFVLSMIGTILGMVVTILTFVIKLSKSKKVRRTAEEMLVVSNKLCEYVEEAEGFKNYTGDEKRNFVLTKMNQFSIDNNIKFDSNYIIEKIESLIATTKKVNVKSEDKDWL